MTTTTLELPDEVRARAEALARTTGRSLAEVLTDTLIQGLAYDTLPDDLTRALDALASLDDEALWRVSQSQPTVEDGVLLDALVDKRRRQGLSSGDEKLLAELVDRHDRVMALRAEAVALLKERGIDVREQVARA